MDEVEPVSDRDLQRAAEREPRGDRGRQGTPGAVGRGGVHPLVVEMESAFRGDQHVGDLVAGEMPAFHQHGLGAEAE